MANSNEQRRSPLMQFLLVFAIVYLVSTMGLRLFFPEQFAPAEPEDTPTVVLTPDDTSPPIYRNLSVTVHNNTDDAIVIPTHCPGPPLQIARQEGATITPLSLSNPAVACEPIETIPARSTLAIDLSPWKYEAFSEVGTYHITLPTDDNTPPSTTITITEPGFFIGIFRAFISKPILNGLVLIASILPNHSLGWSVIILTILVKIILFFPTQHALESQKKLQTLQPKIDAIKKKHEGDQKKITEETMQLWRTEKINPFQSCLPTLFQIPILLGLFFIIRDSGTLELAQHLLYSPFQPLEWTFSSSFFGFDLNAHPFGDATWMPTFDNIRKVFVGGLLPLIVAVLQFGQMKLTFQMKKKQDAAKDKKKDEGGMASISQTQQQMMMYALPVMIFFFSGSLPAAVSIYWGTSTLFAIGQQVVVNRKVQ